MGGGGRGGGGLSVEPSPLLPHTHTQEMEEEGGSEKKEKIKFAPDDEELQEEEGEEKIKFAPDAEDKAYLRKWEVEERSRLTERYKELCREMRNIHTNDAETCRCGMGLYEKMEYYSRLSDELDKINDELSDVVRKMEEYGMDTKEAWKYLY